WGVAAPSVGTMTRVLARVLDARAEPQLFAARPDPRARTASPVCDAPAAASIAPRYHRPRVAGEYVAPRTETERRITTVWEDLLLIGRIGVHDDFFSLGGHSILATQILGRLRETLQVEMALRQLFEHPTVAGLAAAVDEFAASGRRGYPPIVPLPRDRPLPPSFGQERMWLQCTADPESPLYNVPDFQRMTGRVDPGALRRALAETIRRHEVLRTSFRVTDGVLELAPVPAPEVCLCVVDLTRLPREAREPEVWQRLPETVRRPLDLDSGTLIRSHLFRLDDEDHVFVRVLHHIALDGWSGQIFWRDLATLYQAFAAGRPSPLSEPELQYADFAAWQREWIRGETLDALLAYWTRELEGAPHFLDLPTDRPFPAIEDHRGSTMDFYVDREMTTRLQELAQREGVTLYMVLFAVYQLVLHRWTGQDDMLVGALAANRLHPQTHDLMGYFLNTLPLRARVGGDPDFRELLGRVRDATLGADDHQDLPFDLLLKELRPERDASRSPLVQTMFVLQQRIRHGAAPASIAGLRLDTVELDWGTAKFEIGLLADELDDEITLLLEYQSSIFDRSTAVRFAAHYRTALEAIAGDAGLRLSAVPIMDGAEARQLLVEWNATRVEYPREEYVHDLIAEQAARTPDAVAVVSDDGALTYAELERRSGRLAELLRSRGVGPEIRVALCMERGTELVTAVLGVLRAGGAYVPLDPAYPAERLALMLADAGAAVLLAQASPRDSLPDFAGEVVCLDDHHEEIGSGPAGAPPAGMDGRNAAYVIYTSGSTGTPKGVVVEHHSLAAFVRGVRDTFGPGRGEVALAVSSFAFDIWAFEVLAPLTAGATVRLLPAERVRDTTVLADELRTTSAVHAVPALMRQVVAAVRRADGALPGVRRVYVGGEAVPPDLVAEMWEVFPSAELRILYGPTEATVLAASHAVDPEVPPAGQMVGRPLGNVRLYVMDRSGSPAPLCIPGELWIGGTGVARGYLGRPELTAEKFVPDPFSGEPGARLYRSGDRVRWRAGGEIEFLGRVDQQVKVRGFRIEPGEVEAALERHPDVREALVHLREEVPGDPRLVGYVVPEEEREAPSPAELRGFLAGRLPEHMVPAAFVALERLPLTPTGKIDRRALPAPERPESTTTVAPRTPTEELLSGIWAEVLGLERVGAEENFFALGGHSLVATQAVSRVRQTFGVDLPLRALFEAPTVAALAERIEGLRRTGATVVPPIGRVPRGGPLPLSFAQQRLWVMDRLDPGSAAYNMAGALRLRGRLDMAALRASLGALVERHEALRTTLDERDGAPVQVIHSSVPVPLAVVDLCGLPAAAREREAERLAGVEALRPFDLARGPLLRSTLLRLAGDDHVFCFTLHHIVGDAWSMEVLVREVSAQYAAARRSEPARLSELPIQYADYAVWQRGWLSGEVLEAQVGYWKVRLAGAPPQLEVPTDRPRRAGQGVRAGCDSFKVHPRVAAGLRALSRREGTTLFMTLLAAWQALLSKYSGQNDVVVGTPVAGRTRVETEGLIGFFVNMLALRTDLAGDPTWAGLLGRVRGGALGAYDHQDLPFERLVEDLGVERSLEHSPVFQVIFALRSSDGDGTRDELEELTLEPFAGGERVAKFDLDLAITDEGGEMSAALVYRAALFDPVTIARLAGHLEVLLEAMAAEPERRLSGVALLRDAERAQVLEAWNDTAATYPRACVHELVSAQASRTPEAVAVVFGGRTLTYAGLEGRSNRLAHHLRGLGVGPEVRVGVCLERTPELVVALLAVLKAGGAYVPLDPAYPGERLGHMVEDAQISLVLTSSALAGVLPESTRTLALDTVRAVVDARPADVPESGVEPENLSHVIFTSGSTGRPKGVMIRHDSTVVLLHWLRDNVTDEERSSVLFSTSINFDVSVAEVFGTLCWGGKLVLVENALELATVAEPVVYASMVPTATAELLRLGGIPASVRTLNLGGEPLPNELAQALYALGTVEKVGNLYGPTEDTTYSTYSRVPRGTDRVLVGRPVANTQAYVLDMHLQPVPVGAVGELYLSGDGLSRGYAGQPELTAERFLPNPFGPAGSRMYRVMDRARWTAAGELEYFGRTDFQVKVRGFRIELGEVETALRAHPGVRDAVVTVREDVSGEGRLVAYVVADGDTAVGDSVEIRTRLRTRLPEYMVPAAVVVLDRLPLTGSGKIDRRTLPAPEWSSATAYVAPRTDTEDALASIFGDVLKLERVGVEDGFFELGGHSLLATRVISRVREALGAEVPLRALFEAPTVAAFAGYVDAAIASQRGVDTRIPLRRGEGPAPLSFAQQRLWFIHQLDPQSSAYNMPSPLRLRGRLDVVALRRSVSEVVRRHEAVRTVLRDDGGEPRPVVLPAAPVPFPLLDLRGLPEASRHGEALRRLAEEGLRPFDLVRGPLLRVLLVRIAEEEWALCFTLHHIVSDGWSMGVLVREVSALYGAYSRGQASPLPELELQYADFAAWQRAWLTGERLEAQLAYWREKLQGA
ncbi:MAG TPA: amino acid adenylation domain-containing protein, partial [Longimicrobium sp.]|nr:amino acid adenylation domain-containing protein [Longimicrobium sp.]